MRHLAKAIIRVRSVVMMLAILMTGLSPVLAKEGAERADKAKSLAHFTMGVLYDLRGQTSRAIASYERALSYKESETASIHLRLGANYARVGRLDDAVRELTAVNRIDPEDMQSHYLLALIYSTQNEFEKAAGEYETILKSFSSSDPQNIEILVYLGQLYYSQGQLEKAAQQFEWILEIEPDNVEMMYLLGSLYLEVGKRDDAIELFKRGLQIEPLHDGCLNSLAYVYAEDNENLDEALEYASQAIAQDPTNGAYLDSLGWIYYQKQMYIEALKTLKKADSYLTDPIIYEHIGDVYFKLDQPQEAKKYWRKSLEMLPDQESVIQKIEQLDQSRVKND